MGKVVRFEPKIAARSLIPGVHLSFLRTEPEFQVALHVKNVLKRSAG